MRKLFYSLGLAVLLAPLSVSAWVIDFDDNTIYMPTWESHQQWDNLRDTIGRPDFSGGRLVLDGNKLTGAHFFYDKTLDKFGDLFIDKNNDGYFDYVLNTERNRIYGFEDNVLSSRRGDNDPLYKISDHSMWPGGYRNDHFTTLNLNEVYKLIAADKAFDMGSFSSYSHPNSGQGGRTYTFDNISPDLELTGEAFSVAFTMHCANDVISHAANVPLPGTFVLLAGGLYGLARLRRKAQDG